MDKEGPITVMAIIFMILIAGIMIYGALENISYSIEKQANLQLQLPMQKINEI